MKTLSIIKKYKRKSRSKWQDRDDSTILLLATVNSSQMLELTYDRYIYLHRSDVGEWLGISISKQLQIELNIDEQYHEDEAMLSILLHFQDDILNFLEHFEQEFEAIFGIDPLSYFAAAEIRWRSLLE